MFFNWLVEKQGIKFYSCMQCICVFRTVRLNSTLLLKIALGVRKMTQQLKAHTGPAEDPSLISSTHTRQLATLSPASEDQMPLPSVGTCTRAHTPFSPSPPNIHVTKYDKKEKKTVLFIFYHLGNDPRSV